MVLMGGSLRLAAHQSYESVVIDHDIWEFVDRCTTEIVVDDESLAYETAVQVGVGGSYFDTSHTLRWLRSGEHYYGGSFDRSGRSGEEYTMLARAHERVEEILAQPLTYGAPPDAVERIKQYLRDRARSVGAAAPDWAL
jgi:trimethylamine:corrinoid methyltransferase-like protein